jgi:ABC-2 type transport system permease protein
VVVAKAALGVFYIAVMVPLLFALTRQAPERLPLFATAVALLGISLIGFGLLLAGLFKNANQLNTWSGLFLLPIIAPAFVVGLPGPDIIAQVAKLTPTGAAMLLFMNSATEEPVFSGGLQAFVIIVAWAVIAYALLLWQLSRRQA